jgi:hypothetical protein
MLQCPMRMVSEIGLIFSENKLAIGSWRSTESGNGEFVKIAKEAGSTEGAAVVVDEEACTAVPGSEERPGSFCPP